MEREDGRHGRPPGPGRRALRALCAAAALLLSGGAWAHAADCAPAAPAPDCLYVPATSHGFWTRERHAVYIDESGSERVVPFLIRQPVNAPLPLPVMLWSHGGADGKASAATSMVEWSEATAQAGYLTVSIAHPNRDAASRRELCRAIGIADDPTCEVFKYLNWDRPNDIRAVLDRLEQLAVGELRGEVDLQRVGLGGHSAGSGGALSIAGAVRRFNGPPVRLDDARPIAFVALSPQQPGSEGFFDTAFGQPSHSWSQVTAPVLLATGDGDSTCNPGPEPGSCIGDTPYGRRIPFERMPAGHKYLAYLHSANAFHMLFELSTSRCAELGVDEARCNEMARWLKAPVLAFLDAELKQRPAARQWLDSDRLVRASGGVAEWRQR